ncbi:MAG: hypothetical protein ABI047_13760 [Jatrophihabitantaceae bacterium]
MLDHDEIGYRFRYLRDVSQVPDFRPFLGFPDLGDQYESPRLWPFFDLRVMDPRRPDYDDYLARLGLPHYASRLDVLSRSGGEQKGDSVYLAEEPQVADDGQTEAMFLVRGASYATREYSSADDAMRLRPGDRLTMETDHENPVNPAAILLASEAGAPVGWIPDLLIPYVSAVRSGGAGQVTVVQNNGPESPWHLRLLVRVVGIVAHDLRAFSGGQWPAHRLTKDSE